MPQATSNKNERPILGRIGPGEFVGREDALRQITALAQPAAPFKGLLLLSAPLAGATELLRQAFDTLFQQRDGIAPIYFAWTPQDRTAARGARHFLHTFLTQFIAYRCGERTLLDTPQPLRDLADYAAPADYEWVERLVEAFERATANGDERALVRLCLSAPLRATAQGARSLVLFDDTHLIERLSGEVSLALELSHIYARAQTPFVLSGLRRRLLDALSSTGVTFDSVGTLHLDSLGDEAARLLVERVAGRFSLSINEQTRDLIAQQFAGNPAFITGIAQAARTSAAALTSFLDFQKLYTDELLGGRIGRYFGTALEEIAPAPATRRALIRALHESAGEAGGRASVEAWRRKLGLEGEGLQRLVRELHARELASADAAFIETESSLVWRDYLRAAYRLQVAAEPRAQVVAETLTEALKRAPQTMARYYRRAASLKLRELVARFDCQRVPAALLNYDRFSRTYKGANPDEIAAGLDAETELIRLPQIAHVASCAAFQPPVRLECDAERCVAAHGFDAAGYTDANQIVWLVAEIESKLEAGRGIAEVWCDRLSALARARGFQRVRLWLIAPEGFSEEASELLREREAYGSSRQQLELLTARLGATPQAEASVSGNDFEMVIPMDDDTELIAASTVEQIARRLNFRAEAINQIKTALVEACINAAEHSLSPERKIYQRFRLEDDKLVITVASRGVALQPKAEAGNEMNNGDGAENGKKARRGWGLKLIRTLMDEVEFERADDGTLLRMTKYLRR